jgi:hypothetical protein
MRHRAGIVRSTIIAALPQHIQQQNRTLPSVDPIVEKIIPSRKEPSRRRIFGCLRQPYIRTIVHFSLLVPQLESTTSPFCFAVL